MSQFCSHCSLDLAGFSDRLIGLPHIGTDKLDLRSEWVVEEGKESLERLDGAFLADPEQARYSGVDLIDQSQVLVAFGVLDFIHADGADRFQRAVLQTPANHIFDRVAHLVPGSVERLGGFLPRELARPAGQKQHVGLGGLVLAIAPGNLFHHNAAVPAMDAPHPVQKENQKAPERDGLEPPLGQMIVTRRRPAAARADRRSTLARTHVHFDRLVAGAEAGVLIDESPLAMAVV